MRVGAWQVGGVAEDLVQHVVGLAVCGHDGLGAEGGVLVRDVRAGGPAQSSGRSLRGQGATVLPPLHRSMHPAARSDRGSVRRLCWARRIHLECNAHGIATLRNPPPPVHLQPFSAFNQGHKPRTICHITSFPLRRERPFEGHRKENSTARLSTHVSPPRENFRCGCKRGCEAVGSYPNR